MQGALIMSNTVYAATSIEKMASKDNAETGCELEQRCIISQEINVTSSTLAGLIAKLKREWGYDGDYIFVNQNGYLGWNQHEADDNSPLDHAGCIRRWNRGQTVWLCDYTFAIEKRVVAGVKVKEVRAVPGYQFSE
jgi:hypothetical protein